MIFHFWKKFVDTLSVQWVPKILKICLGKLEKSVWKTWKSQGKWFLRNAGNPAYASLYLRRTRYRTSYHFSYYFYVHSCWMYLKLLPFADPRLNSTALVEDNLALTGHSRIKEFSECFHTNVSDWPEETTRVLCGGSTLDKTNWVKRIVRLSTLCRKLIS